MKYLIMCEGSNEQCIINLLLDHDKLKIKRDELIGLKPHNAKQLKHPALVSELKHYGEEVTILRIGDTLKDEIKIPKDLKSLVSKDRIYKFCTKPELEILLIISEGKFKDYMKKHKKTKTYTKENISYNKRKYDQTNNFLEDYFGGKNIDNLVIAIKKYKELKSNQKDELYLSDLLK